MHVGDEHMMMMKELQQLRRGHGLHSADVTTRVGPMLEAACELQSQHTTGERRRQIIAHISDAVTELPPDLRLAVRAAFALEPASTARFLKQRMQWLGAELQRDPRTAVRRVESGLALLAEHMLSGRSAKEGGHAPDGWYVSRMRATLMLNLEPVEVVETREITSSRNNVGEVAATWSMPADGLGDGAELRVELLYGGVLIQDTNRSTPSFWSGRIRLPRPLAAGERHEYQVRVTSLQRSDLRPFYVLTPAHRFDEFVLRAKFDVGDVPDVVTRLDGVPYQHVDENQNVGRKVDPDAVGEVEGSFRNLRQGLSYGFRWNHSRPPG
jgi:hypothetical protein